VNYRPSPEAGSAKHKARIERVFICAKNGWTRGMGSVFGSGAWTILLNVQGKKQGKQMQNVRSEWQGVLTRGKKKKKKRKNKNGVRADPREYKVERIMITMP